MLGVFRVRGTRSTFTIFQPITKVNDIGMLWYGYGAYVQLDASVPIESLSTD